METFVQNLNSKMVQQKSCTEPKGDPREAFSIALAYEEGVYQHKAFEGANGSRNIQEPVMNNDRNPWVGILTESSNGVQQ